MRNVLTLIAALAIASVASAQQVYPQVVTMRPLLSGPLQAGQSYAITTNTARYDVAANLRINGINAAFRTKEVELKMDFEVDVRFLGSQVPSGYTPYVEYYMDGGRIVHVESSAQPVPPRGEPGDPPRQPGVSADAFALGPANAPDPAEGEVFLRTWNGFKSQYGTNIGQPSRAYVMNMYVDGQGYLRGTTILRGVTIKSQVKAGLWDTGNYGSVVAESAVYCRFNLVAWNITNEDIPTDPVNDDPLSISRYLRRKS